ncbi:response regulator transcription factor [Gemmatimonas sp.]|jgi:DNA-binding response OmpR family regulator|uniref:response regulator transcription factor n=1 Tax=Gemmatimonas sp. TaxID=1962908 RepID=UPI0037C0DB1B
MRAEPATGVTVLVVDDEPHIGRIIRTRLEQAGYVVLLAERGTDALSRLESTSAIALVVLDLMLPGISGTEVLRILRADNRWRAVPCIVLTAAGQDAQLREVESLGVSEIMTKPFSPRRLLERVRAHLETTPTAPALPTHAPTPVVP